MSKTKMEPILIAALATREQQTRSALELRRAEIVAAEERERRERHRQGAEARALAIFRLD